MVVVGVVVVVAVAAGVVVLWPPWLAGSSGREPAPRLSS